MFNNNIVTCSCETNCLSAHRRSFPSDSLVSVLFPKRFPKLIKIASRFVMVCEVFQSLTSKQLYEYSCKHTFLW